MLDSKIKFCALECCVFILAILIIAFATLISKEITSSEIVNFKTLSYNWKKGPISEILASSTQFCPSGYESLINDYWPGLVRSCICNDYELNNFIHGKVRRGFCRSKRDSFLFCKDVRGYRPRYYRKYKGKTLCAKRLSMGYLDMAVSSKASFCPVGTRSCGKADSLSNYLCVPTNTACPINYLKVLKKGEKPFPTNLNYTSIDLSGDRVLYFTNNYTEGEIINEFKFSDYQPCTNPTYKNSSIAIYKLDPYFERGTCDKGLAGEPTDNRYKKLDEYNNLDLLNENNITSILYSYPEYPNSTLNHPINLYTRSYIGISEKCFNFFKTKQSLGVVSYNSSNRGILTDLDLISQRTKESSHFSTGVTVYSYIALVTVIIGTIAFLIILSAEDEKYFEPYQCQLVFKVICIVLVFILFILACVLAGQLTHIPNIYSDIQNNGYFSCSDFYTNDLFYQFNSILGFIKPISVWNAVFSVLCIIALSVLIVLFCYAPRVESAPAQPVNEEERFLVF